MDDAAEDVAAELVDAEGMRQAHAGESGRPVPIWAKP